jgi:hypothetical protein
MATGPIFRLVRFRRSAGENITLASGEPDPLTNSEILFTAFCSPIVVVPSAASLKRDHKPWRIADRVESSPA